jgi:hypothetical protein
VSFLNWLEGLPLSEWVAQSEIGYPSMLSIHSIGMAAVVGLLLMLDLRVLGVAPMIPLSAFRRFMPFAWVGFGLNLISGVLLFNATAHRLLDNWPFLSKMACIVVAGGVTWLLWREIKAKGLDRTELGGGSAAVTISTTAKALAVASILLWLLAITFGRLIAYVMDYMILNGK